MITWTSRILSRSNRKKGDGRESNISWDQALRPKEGIFTFPPPSPACNVVPMFELPKETANTPTWMEGLEEGSGFFCSPKLPYLRTMSQQFCCRLWLCQGDF